MPSAPADFRGVYAYADPLGRFHNVDFAFRTAGTGPAFRDPDGEESTEVGWFRVEALPPQTLEVTRRHVAALLRAREGFRLG